LPNTRLESFVFETSDIERYVSLQSQANIKFQSDILDFENYYFIQTMPFSSASSSHLRNIRWLDHAATRAAMRPPARAQEPGTSDILAIQKAEQ